MRGDGRTFRRGQVWWIAYYAPKDGRSVEHREPAIISDRDDAPPRPARTETEARRALKRRLQQGIAVHKAGVQPFQGPAKERVPLEDLLRAMEQDYKVRGLDSLPALRSHLAHVRDYFKGDRAASVTTDRLREYVTHQQAEGMSPQSIHHQLKAIRRAFRLAGTAAAFMPKIPIITVTNVRQGFIERADFEALVSSMGEMRGPRGGQALRPGYRPAGLRRVRVLDRDAQGRDRAVNVEGRLARQAVDATPRPRRDEDGQGAGPRPRRSAARDHRAPRQGAPSGLRDHLPP